MAILFGVTTFLTHEYRAERAERQSLHMRAAESAARDGRYEVAIREFRDALEYDRENVAARLGLAHALFKLERVSEAGSYLIDLRTVEPTHGLVNRLLGDVARKEGRPDEAAHHYRAAVYGRWSQDAEQNRLQARLALIELLGAQGQVLQEVSELAELMKELPEDLSTRRRIGRLLLEAGAPENAARVFQDVVEASPDDADAWAGLGAAEFGRGHYLSARTAFSRSRSIDPDPTETQRWLALSNEIVDLDPTYRRAGTRERHRRSQLLLERALAEARRCVETLPDGADEATESQLRLAHLVGQAEKVLGIKVPAARSEESVEENVSLAEGLWEERLQVCRDLRPADEVLGHVLEKLGQ
jgi:tetratricopeptide (TPR) repeat protein